MDSTQKKVMEENYVRLKNESEEKENIEKKLLQEMELLKKVKITQAEVIKEMKKKFESEKEAMEHQWQAEKAAMKEQKRKLEQMIYDLLKVKDAAQEKLKRVKAICEE
jgi:hypothetical protein